MNPLQEAPIRVTLDVAQLVLLGGLVWGLAKMSGSVGELNRATKRLTEGLETIGATLANTIGRIMVLEDRERRSPQ